MSLVNTLADSSDRLLIPVYSSSGSAPDNHCASDEFVFGIFRNAISRGEVKKGLSNLLVDQSSRQVLYDFVQRNQEFAQSSLVLSKAIINAKKLDRKHVGGEQASLPIDPMRHAFHVIPPLLWKDIKEFERYLLEDDLAGLKYLLSQLGTIEAESFVSLICEESRQQSRDVEFGEFPHDLTKSLRVHVPALFKNYINYDLITPAHPPEPRKLGNLVRYLLLLLNDRRDPVSDQFRHITELEKELLRCIAVRYPKLIVDKFFELSEQFRDLDDEVRTLICSTGVKELFVAMYEALCVPDPFRPLEVFSVVDPDYRNVFDANPEHFPAILPHLLELSKTEKGRMALRGFFNRLGCNGDSLLLDGEVTKLELISLYFQHGGIDSVTSLTKRYELTESEILKVVKAAIEQLKMEGRGSRLHGCDKELKFDDPILQQEWESFLRDKISAFMHPQGNFVPVFDSQSQDQDKSVNNIPCKNLLSAFHWLYEYHVKHPNEACNVKFDWDDGFFMVQWTDVNQTFESVDA